MSKRDMEAREAHDAVLRHIGEALVAMDRLPVTPEWRDAWIKLAAANYHASKIDPVAKPETQAA